MKPLGLGEHGQITITREGSKYVAYVRYRDYAGRGRRLKRAGRSKAEASRNVLKAVREALSADGDAGFTRKSTLDEAARGWLSMFAGLVERGARSPSTLDEYRHIVDRVIVPGIGSLRLGEVSTPRLDRFVQAVLADKGYATAKVCRSVLSGICGWLVRQGALAANPVRDLTPLELDRDRTARALSVDELRGWLALLDANSFARRHDLPELARFMLATGLRLGEALGVTWADVDLAAGTVTVQRTIIRVKGRGLVAKRVKSRASERGLLLPSWCVELLRARRVRLGAFEGPVFPDSHGGWRDRSNVGKAFRTVRGGSDFEWVKTHTYRKTVATLLDQSGASARMIADQLGHSRVSMTQDVYLGRRAGNAANVAALEAYNPDQERPTASGDDKK
jgi:integrase